jgi:hypothetical protein
MYRNLGACPRGSSQDAAKAFFSAQLGLWRCRTVLPFARYTGREGAHMSAEQFNALGFDRTIVATEPLLRLNFPSEDEMRDAVAQQQQLFVDILNNEIDTLTTGLDRMLNPSRIATTEELEGLYNLLLHRMPEPAAYADNVGRNTVFDISQDITSSPEYSLLLSRMKP